MSAFDPYFVSGSAGYGSFGVHVRAVTRLQPTHVCALHHCVHVTARGTWCADAIRSVSESTAAALVYIIEP